MTITSVLRSSSHSAAALEQGIELSVRRTNVNTGHKFVAVHFKNDESVIQDLLAEHFVKNPESILPRLIRRRRAERLGLVCVEVHPGPSKRTANRKAKMTVMVVPKVNNRMTTRGQRRQNASQGFGPGAYANGTANDRVGFLNQRFGVPSAIAVTAPAAEGFIIPRAHFGFVGKAQKMADYDDDRSVRVTGCGLFLNPITAGSVTAAAGFGGTASYWNPPGMTPSSVDPRLANIEKIFQYYALREVRFSYIPAVGATTAVQVALGVAQDSEISVALPTPTQSQILELNTSVLTPAWQVATMTYTHRGTKLWECYSAAAEVGDTKIQAYLAAVLLGATTSVTYGQLYVEYICDFYEPSPILPAVN